MYLQCAAHFVVAEYIIQLVEGRGAAKCEDTDLHGGPPWRTGTLINLMNSASYSVLKLNLELRCWGQEWPATSADKPPNLSWDVCKTRRSSLFQADHALWKLNGQKTSRDPVKTHSKHKKINSHKGSLNWAWTPITTGHYCSFRCQLAGCSGECPSKRNKRGEKALLPQSWRRSGGEPFSGVALSRDLICLCLQLAFEPVCPTPREKLSRRLWT